MSSKTSSKSLQITYKRFQYLCFIPVNLKFVRFSFLCHHCSKLASCPSLADYHVSRITDFIWYAFLPAQKQHSKKHTYQICCGGFRLGQMRQWPLIPSL